MIYGTTALGPGKSGKYEMGTIMTFGEKGFTRVGLEPGSMSTHGVWLSKHPDNNLTTNGQFSLTPEGNTLITEVSKDDGESSILDLKVSLQHQGDDVGSVIDASFVQVRLF